MAEKRDLLDDLIDIQSDWQKVSNPLGNVVGSLAVDPEKVPVWNPADYKERPRTNPAFCLRSTTKRNDLCGACEAVCPVGAVSAASGKVGVSDACRKCGLCATVCPTDVFTFRRIAPTALYDTIARVAGAYEQCYVTCTRALGRVPQANEIVLPCVGAMSSELWLSLLAEYGNVSVYLPLGICDRCRNTTGEEVYADEISRAETWTGLGVGLEVDEADLSHELSRAYKRSQFVSGMAQAGATIATRGVPVLAGAKAVAERVRTHSKQLGEMQRSLERAVGEKSSQNRRRVLTQRRKLMMGTLQRMPELAQGIELAVPACDHARCTMCGDCVSACPVHACELDRGGRFSVESAYCVNCGACVDVCADDALAMGPADPADLVIPDPNAGRVAEQRAKVAEAKQKVAATARHALDALEGLDDAPGPVRE